MFGRKSVFHNKSPIVDFFSIKKKKKKIYFTTKFVYYLYNLDKLATKEIHQ